MEMILAVIAVCTLTAVMAYALGKYAGYDSAYDDICGILEEIHEEQMKKMDEMYRAEAMDKIKEVEE